MKIKIHTINIDKINNIILRNLRHCEVVSLRNNIIHYPLSTINIVNSAYLLQLIKLKKTFHKHQNI